VPPRLAGRGFPLVRSFSGDENDQRHSCARVFVALDDAVRLRHRRGALAGWPHEAAFAAVMLMRTIRVNASRSSCSSVAARGGFNE